ncbi:MAG: UvrD-helicase domain-containing protein [Bacteroidales bacterium]|nr:UvrD-helicase domain-containing protein [Bacteroidales bacterium]
MEFDKLNEKQIEAVKATEGHVRIIAGAGSGKTRVLAYRYAYLVNELGINPANILCLTFTNKAAAEMRSRIAGMVPKGSVNDFVCTIHSFCVKFLREEIHRMGYPKTFLILDEEDMKSLAKEVLAENNVTRSTMTAQQLLEEFSYFKATGKYIPDYLLTSSPNPNDKQSNLCFQLLMKQHKSLGLDFQDLIYFTLYLFQAFPEVLQKWQRRFNYIMVDEVQDCSESDWSVFMPLSDRYHNLFIVGDPDQCIYEWRGSRLSNFLEFKTDKDVVLSRNYRSTSTILDAANAIIGNNENRIPKDLFTKNNRGTVITHFHGKNEEEESSWIATQILKLVEKDAFYNQFAILIRASYLSRSIEQALLKNKIAYVIWGGIRFFERREIKDSLSYLRLVATDDDLAFKRIINVPSRKIGKVTLEKVQKIAKDKDCSLFEAIKVYKETLSMCVR